jgi:hypothetical protein
MRIQQIMDSKKGYTGFELDGKQRRQLLQTLVPVYSDVIAHHVTYKFGVGQESIPTPPKEAFIVGYANDPSGLEAYVVSINGSTTRPDGKIFHITWSLDKSKGKKPVQSNNLLARGYQTIDPIPVKLTPKFFSF